VSGGIAVYKSVFLLRLLMKQGAKVQIVMTESAKKFVTPLTFQALSGEIVRSDLFDEAAEAGMGHIELAQWADLIIIAPATANTMAKIACGIADNLLTTLCLASQAPLLIAPAMNQQMWNNTITQENIAGLSKKSSVFLCGPAQGEQACGDVGYGRMEEPQIILERSIEIFGDNLNHADGSSSAKGSAGLLLAGKQILITAGPTIEDIDPVRYMSNRSSGKMGYAIARAARNEGAKVILVSGPVSIEQPKSVEFHPVRSAQQMHKTVLKLIGSMDIFIATAAVADYRLLVPYTQKIKKNSKTINIELTKNPDILADVTNLPDKPLTIGFAAETNDLENYAIDKLKRKNLDMIAANQVMDEKGKAKGFEKDDNELCLFWQKENKIHSKKLPLAQKQILAEQLIKEIGLNLL